MNIFINLNPFTMYYTMYNMLTMYVEYLIFIHLSNIYLIFSSYSSIYSIPFVTFAKYCCRMYNHLIWFQTCQLYRQQILSYYQGTWSDWPQQWNAYSDNNCWVMLQGLREKCPTTEFFLVRIFLYSDWIRRFTFFTLDTFHAVEWIRFFLSLTTSSTSL